MGVRSNAVSPSTTITHFHLRRGMAEDAFEKYKEKAKGTHALGRTGTVEDMASAIAFLADNERAAFTTGTCMFVDGGKAVMTPR